MDFLANVDYYCERTDASLLAEPLNLFSNVSFFIAALALYILNKKYSCKHAPLLISLIILVGIGSSLFHSIANILTMFADIIPIAVFVFVYLWIALRYLACFNHTKAVIGLLLFMLVSYGVNILPPAFYLNGSIAYVPCLLALFILSIFVAKNNIPAAKLLILAGGCFTFSLSLRTMDMGICELLPVGTHIGWHLVNGLVLYLLGRAVIIHCKETGNV